jgi:hypothetical protein
MGSLIEGRFPLMDAMTVDSEEDQPTYEVPDHASRDELLDFIANASVDLFTAGTSGDLEELDNLQEFLGDCFARFDPPLSREEFEAIHRKSIRTIKQMEKR